MTIAVTTPSGHVGSRVVQLLMQAGTRPVLLMRDPAKLDPGVRENVEVEAGDLTDAAYVEHATRGIDALLCAIPENFASDDPLAEMTTVADNIAAAVRSNGVSWTVLISSVGAELKQGLGLIDGLAHAERVLAETGTTVLCLRSGFYFTNLLGSLDALRAGSVSATIPGDESKPWVDPRDIGDVAAARLLATDWTGVDVQGVHGPADLTWNEVATILSDALGRKIAYQVDDEDATRKGMQEAGMSAAAADAIVAMNSAKRLSFTPEQPRTTITTTPTTLGGWAYTTLKPLL
jgi:uncharacterized protein YbjT (DUF2867 family)